MTTNKQTSTPSQEGREPGEQYLERLGRALGALSEDDRTASIDYYREMIQDRLESGMSEREAVQDLEPPESAAAAITNELPALPRAIANGRRLGEPLFWILLIVGSPVWLTIMALLLLVILGAYLLIWASILIIWAFAGIGLAAGLSALLICIWSISKQPTAFTLLILAMGLGCTAIGMLAIPLATAFTRIIVRASAWLTRSIRSLYAHEKADTQPGHRHARHPQATRTILITSGALLIAGIIIFAVGYSLANGDLTILNQRLPIGEIHI